MNIIEAPIMNVFAGGPGTGKTTLGKMFTQGSDIPFFNPSDKADTLSAGLSDAGAYKSFIDKIHSYIDDKKSFSMETNLSDEAIVLIQKAKENGFIVNTHYMSISDSEIQAHRLEKKGNIEDKRIENLEKYNAQSLKNLSDALYLSNKGVVYNNTGLGPVEAMELRNGVIKDITSTLPGPVQDKLTQNMSLKEGEIVVPSDNVNLSFAKGVCI